MKRKIPSEVRKVYFRSDSASYNKEVVAVCEEEGWELSITADQTKPPMKMMEALPENAWQRDTEDDTVEYAEVSYQPVGWPKAYRYLIKRKREKNTTCQRSFFESLAYSYYAVVTNRTGNIQTLMKVHAKRGTCEKRICQFTNEFLSHLPMGGFFANWAYLLCAQLAYNVADLVLPEPYRKKHIKRIRRCIGVIASKIVTNGRQIRMKMSTMHRWWEDFVHAWKAIPSLNKAIASG